MKDFPVALEPLTCQVCNKNEALGVACSVWGAISFAYCRECLDAGRDHYGAMVGGLFGLTDAEGKFRIEEVSPEYHPVIYATLEFYGKTLDDLAKDLVQLEKDYEEYYNNMPPDDPSGSVNDPLEELF